MEEPVPHRIGKSHAEVIWSGGSRIPSQGIAEVVEESALDGLDTDTGPVILYMRSGAAGDSLSGYVCFHVLLLLLAKPEVQRKF
jgi:hypothetical protein